MHALAFTLILGIMTPTLVRADPAVTLYAAGSLRLRLVMAS